MEYLDIIGIGAINFDYIFFCKDFKRKNQTISKLGQEHLNITRKMIYKDIDKLMYTTEHTNQVCGSAYFALKTAHAISPELKLSYVGVCGKPTKRELDAGFSEDIKNEFSFLNNTDWLFYDEGEPGIALVRLVNGVRNWVDIDPGVNSKLKEYIIKKEEQQGENKFVEYLSKSKWIHMSSLSDFEQFQYLVQKVKMAKRINPLLKVSVDPGFEYTQKYKRELRDIFSIADYVFLNNNEVDNLIGNNGLLKKNRFQELSSVFNSFESHTQIIILKSQNKHTLLNFREEKWTASIFLHKKIKKNKIRNDTGAGDSFAGGYIASMLSAPLLIHHSLPIRMGAIAAMARMKSYEDPFSTIADDTKQYIYNLQKSEKDYLRQSILLFFERLDKQSPMLFGGIILGGLIVLWIRLFRK